MLNEMDRREEKQAASKILRKVMGKRRCMFSLSFS